MKDECRTWTSGIFIFIWEPLTAEVRLFQGMRISVVFVFVTSLLDQRLRKLRVTFNATK